MTLAVSSALLGASVASASVLRHVPSKALQYPAAVAKTGSWSYLDAVTCLSQHECLAVGSRLNSHDEFVTLSEMWDGTRWKVLPSINPKGSTITYLNSISCPLVTWCMAVGVSHEAGSNGFLPLAESWNGHTWRVLATPEPHAATTSELEGVKCALASYCFAVGSFGTNPDHSFLLAESWNGTRWAVAWDPDPPPPEYNVLQAVTCTSWSHCVAVGAHGRDSDHTRALAVLWNGRRWRVMATPDASRASVNLLSGVKCNGPRCMAVGTFVVRGRASALAESFDGKRWHVLSVPESETSQGLYGLSAVWCAAADSCISVGEALLRSVQHPDAARWNGVRWNVSSVPSSAQRSDLVSLSCRSIDYCIAVGRSGYGPLAELWEGGAWHVLPNPRHG